jgi:hypothetical protein
LTLTARVLGITTDSPLPEATVGEAYSETLVAAGGTAAYHWSISMGALPGGLTLTPAGVLSGVPTVAGTLSFAAQVVESGGQQAGKDFTLTVKPPAATAVPAGAVATPAGHAGGITDPTTLARAVLRTVRRAINEFRDERWNALVVARNRLAGTMIFTGLTAYVLLAIAIIKEATNDAIVAASAFYLVGAVTGLLSRLYGEARTDAAVEDYGLSAMRLLSTPLVSGLVAIAGVVLVAMLPLATSVFTPPTNTPPAALQQPAAAPSSIAPTPPVPTMDNIFDLNKNLLGLLVAAVFGLTPGLLFNRLQQQAETYKADLKTSEATQPPRT